MITPIAHNYKGLISITGPTKSGKSKLAEFLISEQELVTYIATSKPRPNDSDWQVRIDIHRKRRPDSWTLIEHPKDICQAIESIEGNESILIDSLGGLVEQHLIKDDDQWNNFQMKFLNCLSEDNLCIVVVSEEVGWGIVPATPIGHLFRERHSTLTSLISRQSKKRWLAINGTAIDLDKFGDLIP
ncbi:bifunctional adenosylcobinamide kinase/adenosylcobinamide-phosphate guanylyltransferase [Prochlorococcus marinus]|uniref:bifunctional adenosylcobinamide kinase/adenosylcobinamide-phosphate guanylyltransferase n=1 Tax=Prochlorococcus marinus TaxID=1219 RepID=UPI0022B43FA9|nr:bifunctional adenosylcobinamide kinase/adenosylcobinamide-phosphate guanylyltransferase [Prochlorococcus marinus]